MSQTKLISQTLVGEYRIAALERDGVKFWRMRTANIYSGNIDYLDWEEGLDLARFMIEQHSQC